MRLNLALISDLYDTVSLCQVTHASDSHPHLSQEVYEHVLDFLWDKPVALARCCMVCRAFRPVALQHLTEFYAPNLSSAAILGLFSRALRDKEHRTISRRTFRLEIYEDPRRPFAHLFPLLLPGCDVPGTTCLQFEGLDWAARHPHSTFFDYLSYYSNVSELTLSQCRFGSASELRRFINALTKLATLTLSGITVLVGSALRGSIVTPIHSQNVQTSKKLVRICLHCPPGGEDRWTSSDSSHRQTIASILAMCAVYSSVDELSLELDYFDTPTRETQPDRLSSQWTDQSAEELRVAGSYHPLHSLVLRSTSTTCTMQLMSLVSTPHSCCKLEELRISHEDSAGPTGRLLSSMIHTLRLAGSTLKRLNLGWTWGRDLDLNYKPQIDLVSNVCLEDLALELLDVPPVLSTLERALVHFITSITSSHLKKVCVVICLKDHESSDSERVPDRYCVSAETTTIIQAFHTVLSSELFLRLPEKGVRVDIGVESRSKASKMKIAASVKGLVSTLFAPWVDRGTMTLGVEPNPTLSSVSETVKSSKDVPGGIVDRGAAQLPLS